MSAPELGLYTFIKSLCSNLFFSETTLLVKVNFNVKPPWEEGTYFFLKRNNLGHMPKMAAVSIYGKTTSPEPKFYDLET